MCCAYLKSKVVSTQRFHSGSHSVRNPAEGLGHCTVLNIEKSDHAVHMIITLCYRTVLNVLYKENHTGREPTAVKLRKC